MATENVTQALPTEPTAVTAMDYVRFVELLEGGMPKGTRAYMVTLDDDGARRLIPVRDGSSVLDLGTDLLRHLNERSLPTEQAAELRSWCNELLERRGLAEFNLSATRHDLVTDAAHEAALLIEKARGISEDRSHDDLEKTLLLRGHLKRLSELVGVIDGAVNPDALADSDEQLQERLHG